MWGIFFIHPRDYGESPIEPPILFQDRLRWHKGSGAHAKRARFNAPDDVAEEHR